MLIVEAPRSKRTLEQLFNNEYWKDIFVGSMLNFFPFDKDDIRKIGYQELCHNSNAEWDVETLCQYVKECAKHFDRYEWLNILHNRKFTWDDNLLDKTGASSYDWIYLWLSKLSNVKWTNTFILKHCECFDWGQLTLNPNITWTEKLLFEVEDKIVWSNLIGNPNVKWSRKIIERVKKALEQVHAYAENYNFYKEYVDLAISCGFNPFTSFNIFENNLDINFVKDHSSKLKEWALNKQICANCKGLNECKFNDGRYFNIIKDSSKKFINVSLDEKEDILSLRGKEHQFDGLQINILIKDLERCIDGFTKAVFFISNNYVYSRNESKQENEIKYTFEEAKAACKALRDGYDDWMLPEADYLDLLADKDELTRQITEIGWYWSSWIFFGDTYVAVDVWNNESAYTKNPYLRLKVLPVRIIK